MLRKSLTLALLGASSIGYAAEDQGGAYIGASIGQSKVKDDSIDFSGTDTAFRVVGGYQFNQYVAIEGGYLDIGSPDDTIQGIDVQVDASAFQAAVVGQMPFNEKFSGFAKAGILFWDSEVKASTSFASASADDSGEDLSWGLGVKMNLNKSSNIRLEFEGADIGDTDYRAISLGYSWLFN